ncbi:L-histidine N(alpha)-methyltransferase [Candidatus Falkowbacteria bacterium]|nr:L-histidine N(alpha)-methyltransferase [Candidatus Falkowbacteria bacterium]
MKVVEEKYDQAWFKKRAFESLQRIDANSWDYSDSLLLYSEQGQEAYESAQVGGEYYDLVTLPEHEHLKAIAKQVVASLPDNFVYIDLGPGTEGKEAYFFNELKGQGKSFVYTPVDISDYFLGIAVDHAKEKGVAVKPIKKSFEELPDSIKAAESPRFVSLLGLTFSNYKSPKIISLLAEIAGKGGYILIDVQVRDRIDIQAVQEAYQKYMPPACDSKIRLLDLDPEKDVSPRTADASVSIWCSILNPNTSLKEKGIKADDKLLLFQSLRPTREDFEKELKGFDYQLLDEGGGFISALIKT